MNCYCIYMNNIMITKKFCQVTNNTASKKFSEVTNNTASKLKGKLWI